MLISIIMPAYNAEKYIEQAIKSVQEQTYQEWELIILDDGSSDKTEMIVNEISKTDSRIQYKRNLENMGVAKTRNKGLLLAKGEWIAFLDSDDFWNKDKLEKQVELVKNSKSVKFVFTGSNFVDESGDLLGYILKVPNKITYKELLKQNVISCSSVMVEKGIIAKHLMPEMNVIHEDFATWLSVLKEVREGYGIDEPLLTYRVSSNSKSGNKLKAARMTLNVYRYIRLKWYEIVYYMFCYTVRSLKKYYGIFR